MMCSLLKLKNLIATKNILNGRLNTMIPLTHYHHISKVANRHSTIDLLRIIRVNFNSTENVELALHGIVWLCCHPTSDKIPSRGCWLQKTSEQQDSAVFFPSWYVVLWIYILASSGGHTELFLFCIRFGSERMNYCIQYL